MFIHQLPSVVSFGYKASMGTRRSDSRGGQFSSLTRKTRLLKLHKL